MINEQVPSDFDFLAGVVPPLDCCDLLLPNEINSSSSPDSSSDDSSSSSAGYIVQTCTTVVQLSSITK